MKTRLLPATALALMGALAPGLALADCAGMKHVSASACQPGQAWDAAAERCVSPTSS